MRKPDVSTTKTALRRGEINKHAEVEAKIRDAAVEIRPEDVLFDNEKEFNHREHREKKK